MINKKDNVAEWAIIMYELEDAVEHLQNLIKNLNETEDYGDIEYSIDLGHVYSHLNRAWNSRNHIGDQSADDFGRYSKFPNDIWMGKNTDQAFL